MVEFKRGTETLYNDIIVGGLFEYDNAIWVALRIDRDTLGYPAMCISSEYDDHFVGDVEFIPYDTKVIELLKD